MREFSKSISNNNAMQRTSPIKWAWSQVRFYAGLVLSCVSAAATNNDESWFVTAIFFFLYFFPASYVDLDVASAWQVKRR